VEYRQYRECGKEPEKPGSESADPSDRGEGPRSTGGSCKAGSATDAPTDSEASIMTAPRGAVLTPPKGFTRRWQAHRPPSETIMANLPGVGLCL
jgi:hypothetical protein